MGSVELCQLSDLMKWLEIVFELVVRSILVCPQCCQNEIVEASPQLNDIIAKTIDLVFRKVHVKYAVI